MKSRVHPRYKARYHVGNWAEYDRSLVQRGDITLWISSDAIDSWTPLPSGKRGGQRKYSDLAIETAITLRLVFHLPLRQTEGFLNLLFRMMGIDLEAPDHTTLSRRSQHLDVQLPRTATNKPIHLIIDSTGLSIVGDGRSTHEEGRRVWSKAACDGSGRFNVEGHPLARRSRYPNVVIEEAHLYSLN